MSSNQPKHPGQPRWRADVDAAMGAVALGQPDAEARARGAVLRFEWYASDGEALVMGDLAQGPAGLIMTRAEICLQGSSGITRDLLRRVPIGDVLAAARTYLRRNDPTAGPPVVGPAEIPVTSGRTKMTDDLLRQVAAAYIEETGPDKGRGAIKRMTGRFGRPDGTVQTWIKRARKEGWLAPGPPGRMGAEPGPKLIAWRVEEMKAAFPGLISHVVKRPDGTIRDVSEPFSILRDDDASTAPENVDDDQS